MILNDPITFFDGFRVRRGTEIAEFGDILAVKVVVSAMAVLGPLFGRRSRRPGQNGDALGEGPGVGGREPF